jgi:hypothetical protein
MLKTNKNAIDGFIYYKVNSDNIIPIPLHHISNSLRGVWINIWKGMTEKEREFYVKVFSKSNPKCFIIDE